MAERIAPNRTPLPFRGMPRVRPFTVCCHLLVVGTQGVHPRITVELPRLPEDRFNTGRCAHPPDRPLDSDKENQTMG